MNDVLAISNVLLWVVLALNLLLTFTLMRVVSRGHLRDPAPSALDVGLKQGVPAPRFSGLAIHGAPVSQDAFGGRRLLIFTNPTCKPCMHKLADFQAAADVWAGRGVDVILVIDAELDSARSMANEHKISMPAISAPRSTNPLFSKFRISATPTYCLIGADDRIEQCGVVKGSIDDILSKGHQTHQGSPTISMAR